MYSTLLCLLQDDIYGEDIYGGVGEVGKTENGSHQVVQAKSGAPNCRRLSANASLFFMQHGMQAGIKTEHADVARLATSRYAAACSSGLQITVCSNACELDVAMCAVLSLWVTSHQNCR